MRCEYKTKNVCASTIKFDLEGNVVTNVSFQGGCNGNLKAIGKLVEGMKVEDVIERVQGVDCGGRGTSCGDQLARALTAAMEAGAK